MVRALNEYDIRGISTTIEFCRWLLETPAFRAGEFDTTTVDRLVDEYRRPRGARDAELEELAAIAAALKAQRAGSPRPSRPVARAPEESVWERQARLDNLR
jgi:acetyl/propionyl-CoA carboxylase alpha subunit